MPRINGSAAGFDGRLAHLRLSPRDASFQLYGFFDGIHGRCVDGWVFDAASPSSTLAVDVWDGTRPLGTARANLFRADLDAIGIAGGRHAFRFELPDEIFNGENHEIWVRVANSGLAVPGSPRSLETGPVKDANKPEDPQKPAASMSPLRTYEDVILRSLHDITESLVTQTQLLRALVAHLPSISLPPAEAHPSPLLPALPKPEPAFASALARPIGDHDYIIFAIIDWHYRIQRPQHFATRLAAMGNRVFYLGVTFHELAPGGPRFIMTGEPADGVFEIALCCRFPAPIIYNGISDAEQLADLVEAIRCLIKLLQIQRPVCLLNLPSWYPVAQAIPGAAIVFDCLDYLAGFNNVAPRVIELEQTLIAEADSVLVTSDFLRDAIGKHRQVCTIRNGVDVAYFSRPPPERGFEASSRPVIGYYGAIADWFDIELVVHCARRHPEWHFVLIGAVDCCDIGEATQTPNILFLGEKPYRELTQYLYAFDVCLIPFKLTDLTRATNPVKVYEYLCAGKPVVTTDLPELRRLPTNIVQLARSPPLFEKAIEKCLRRDTPVAVRQRRLWAAKQSWDTRARKLAKVVACHYPAVSVIVLCRNNLSFTMACLQSLLQFSDYPKLEIICVDNASTDDTPNHLRQVAEQRNSVRYIRNDTNLGFAAGNNVGIRSATGEFVILLNNDTYVTRGWVRDLIRPMLRDAEIGMTGPLTNMAGNEQKVAIAYSNMAEMAQVSAPFTAARRRVVYPADTLGFFCIAIRRDVLDAVGELDESYSTGYFEDDDYCRRVQRAGYRLVICDDVFVHHHHSASFDQLGEGRKAALMKRNRRIYERRWGPWRPHTYRAEAGFGEG